MQGHRRPVVQAVRADHRLLGAGVAVRLVLARPDAVGLLAGPAARGARAAELDRPRARPLQPLVRPPGRPLQGGHRLGARPPAGDGRASSRVSFFGAIALPGRLRRRRLHPGRATARRSTCRCETPPGSNLDYTAHQGARAGEHRPRAQARCAYTYTSDRQRTGSGDVDTGSIYIRLVPKKERDVSQQELARQIRQRGRSGSAAPRPYCSQGGAGRQPEADPGRSSRGQDIADAQRARRWRSRRECARCPGAVDVGLSTRGTRSRSSRCELDRGLAGSLGAHRRPGRAGAAPGIRRRRRRRLGRSRRQDARRHRPPRARGARATPTDLAAALPLHRLARRPERQPAQPCPARPGRDDPRGIGPAQIDHLDRDKRGHGRGQRRRGARSPR